MPPSLAIATIRSFLTNSQRALPLPPVLRRCRVPPLISRAAPTNFAMSLSSSAAAGSPTANAPLALPHSLATAAASIGVDSSFFLPSEAALEAHVKKSWDFFDGIGRPKYVCAPMVHQSNLPFRSIVRKYGMPLCYTPMINSGAFIRSLMPEKHFNTIPSDRPLVAQFAGDDPAVLLEAAKRVQNDVDAIDINLGCPQGIARKGHYGSFLLEDTQIVQSIVSTLHKGLSVPVTCKIRVRLNDPTGEKTLAMALALQYSGCSLLTLHGRTRDMKKEAVEETDWAIIKRVKQALRIPVFANGSIETRGDADECAALTGVDGVMISEALLCWPAMVSHPHEKDMPFPVDMADETIAAHVTHQGHEVDLRPHLFKILFRELAFHTNLRSALGMPGGGADLLAATRRLRYEQLRLWETYQAHKAASLTTANAANADAATAAASGDAAADDGLEQWLWQYARDSGLTSFRGVDPLAPEKDAPLLPVEGPTAAAAAAAADAAAVAAAAATEEKRSPLDGVNSAETAPRKGPPQVLPGSIRSRKLNRAAAFRNTIASIDAPTVTLPTEAAVWLREHVYSRFPAWYHRHWNPRGRATAGQVSAAAAAAAEATAAAEAEAGTVGQGMGRGWGEKAAAEGKQAARARWGAPEQATLATTVTTGGVSPDAVAAAADAAAAAVAAAGEPSCCPFSDSDAGTGAGTRADSSGEAASVQDAMQAGEEEPAAKKPRLAAA